MANHSPPMPDLCSEVGKWLISVSVPKTRRPRFDLHLRVYDLNNVPYVSGRSYIKWHLPHSGAEGHRGRTDKYPIKDHKVVYNYDANIPVRMVIDKSGMLQELVLEIDVVHAISSGGKDDRIGLGNIKLNLAEYVEASEQEGEDGVTRRYLMQESKINSTLKVSIFMKQTEGDRNFSTPPLRVAPVFSGIAGIQVGEPEDSEGTGPLPAVNSKAQVAGDELKELYRKTIAANWTVLPGELSADKCIEDIFSGGDGWGTKLNDSAKSSGKEGVGNLTDEESSRYHRRKHSSKWHNGFFRSRPNHLKRHSKESLGRRSVEDIHAGQRSMTGVKGRASFEQQSHSMKDEADIGHNRQANEIDEMEVRDDLRSWKIPLKSEMQRPAPQHHKTELPKR